MGAFVAPALGQQPKLVYWAYQFLRASDEARVHFAQEWATKNKVEMQITLVPWKEFMPKITAAIQAQATPDIVESGGVELRALGQLLDVTDLYETLEKEHGGWLGSSHCICARRVAACTTSSTAWLALWSWPAKTC